MAGGLAGLEQAIGYQFKNVELLEHALVHRSYLKDDPVAVSNERLEFLGDAVLGWVVADHTYRDAAQYPEGKLTDIRKTVVNGAALAVVARRLGLGDHLTLGRAEAALGGAAKASILSDAMEAVIGAVYLDGGADQAHDLVLRLFESEIEDAAAGRSQFDFKTMLQEWLAQHGRGRPRYAHREEGPAHEPTFHVQLTVDGELLGEATGGSKKAAEQLAAEIAYKNLDA